jgi:hypothetical protein
MTWWPFRRRVLPPPDLIAFLSEISRSWPPNYGPENRYADFRQLFLGSEQGQRVLQQIVVWSNLWRPSFVKGDPGLTAFHDGQRNLGLTILAALHNEPKPRPSRVTTKPKDE